MTAAGDEAWVEEDCAGLLGMLSELHDPRVDDVADGGGSGGGSCKGEVLIVIDNGTD